MFSGVLKRPVAWNGLREKELRNFAMVFAAAYILVNLKQSYIEKKLSKLAYLKLKLSLVWLTVRILVKNFKGIFGGGRV